MTESEIHPDLRATTAEPRLYLTRHKLSFVVSDDLQLPRNEASIWRSALGKELHAISEGADALNLISCHIPCRDLYSYMFESPPPRDSPKMGRYQNVPHPFVIAAPCTPEPVTIAKGARVSFDMTLIGRATEALPLLVTAFERAAKNGLGENAVQAHLLNVEYVPLDPFLPSFPRQVRVVIETPLRLMKTKKPRDGSARLRRFVVGPTDFRAHRLFSSLVRRISMLMTFHADVSLDETLFPDLKAAGRRIPLTEVRLNFSEDSRWSSTHKTGISLDGLTGDFTLDLTRGRSLWPYLWLGQWIHAGKHATEGLGAYRVEAL